MGWVWCGCGRDVTNMYLAEKLRGKLSQTPFTKVISYTLKSWEIDRVSCLTRASSPILLMQHIGNAHNYSSSSAAKAAVNQLGREIQLGLIPEALGPIVFTFTGKGNVAQVCVCESVHVCVCMYLCVSGSPSSLPVTVRIGSSECIPGAAQRVRGTQ